MLKLMWGPRFSPASRFRMRIHLSSIARLRQLIKMPGLLGLSNKFRLNDDQYEDLLAIESYINWTHNTGHSNITTRTHGSFNTFIEQTFDVNNPIAALQLHQGTASPIISPSDRTTSWSLADRGVSTGTAGSDMRVTLLAGRSQGTAVPDNDMQSPASYGTVVRTQRGLAIQSVRTPDIGSVRPLMPSTGG